MNVKKITPIVLTLLILLCGITGICTASVTFTDTPGNSITLPGPAERVVCLNSDVAETMVALGAGDKIVGLTDSVMTDTVLMSHIPNAENVGNWQTPSLEKVLQLKPDAVITYSSSKPKNTDQFINAGINLTYLDCYKMNTLDHDVRALGSLIGAPDRAEQYIGFKDRWVNKITGQVADLPADALPEVYIEGYSDYSANGKDSGMDQLVTIAKGNNIASDLGEQWPKVTPEWVISEDPDLIIKAVSVKPDKTLAQVRDDVMKRAGFETLTAVKDTQVYALNGDLAYGLRSPVGLVYVAKALHPDRFADISPDEALKEYADIFVSGMENGEYYAPVL
ncbi:MAG: ABC transporter substrate-binding protein [Methanospirillum sp.]|uniref:ABC transporter substrate-binding protein n=1 Tax=Methanospirillum sp. TaxID=45200 RepID=UPI002374645B|nr:ABC transporter substrate-binding protein [Methanospirillum sp.]MDD1727599.1 ABC transporter substrate-binding protein [Methanospirillum sp.]